MTAWATGEEVGGDAPAARVVGGVARGGGRRCPAPFPARRPQGSAPTVPVGAPVRVVLDGARTVSVGWRPYGLCWMAPVRFYPLRGRCLCGARVGGGVAWGWATLPPAGPRQAPTRERPYGSCRGARTGCVGWRPYGFCRGCPYGLCRMAPVRFLSGAPVRVVLDGARTVLSPAGKMSMRRAWGWATLPRPVPRQAPTRERPYGSCRMAPLRFVSDGARTGCVGWRPYGSIPCGARPVGSRFHGNDDKGAAGMMGRGCGWAAVLCIMGVPGAAGLRAFISKLMG